MDSHLIPNYLYFESKWENFFGDIRSGNRSGDQSQSSDDWKGRQKTREKSYFLILQRMTIELIFTLFFCIFFCLFVAPSLEREEVVPVLIRTSIFVFSQICFSFYCLRSRHTRLETTEELLIFFGHSFSLDSIELSEQKSSPIRTKIN